MNKGKRRIDRMNSFVVRIDLGEKESNACYMSPDGEIKEGFKFLMNKEGYTEFRKKIPVETRIAFEASGSAYAVSKAMKGLGYNDITVAHPKELSWTTKSKKKNDLIKPWKHPVWESTRPEHAKFPDEKWQTDIMYVKIRKRFFYPVIFIDEYSRYIVHHNLLTSMDGDSVSMEAQAGIGKLRKDSIAEPTIQSDNGSSFIAMKFRMVLKQNNLTQRLMRPHTPEQNGIVEMATKTIRESLVPVILTDYKQGICEISRIIEYHNNNRRHSSLNYLTPIQYYRGNPEELLRIRESKIEKARILRRERNMKERKGGETAGTVS